jgi:uncharacterized membrane protein YfcA
MRRGVLTAMALGVLAGMASGVAGVGGGIVMVPILVLVLGLGQHRAHGTSLAIMVLTAVVGAALYAREGQVETRLALQFAVGGIVGAVLGPWLASLVKAPLLKKLFGVLLLLVALRMFTSAWFGHVLGTGGLRIEGAAGLALESATGLAAGVVAGFFGVGGGIVMVPAMVLLLGRPQVMAQGVSLCVIVPVSIVAALGHQRRGNVDPRIVRWMALPTALGSVLGARIALGPATEPVLRTIFSLLLAATGYLMLAPRRQATAADR